MKHKKPLAVRIFIRICVVFMTISLIWAYVVYMFTPQQSWENWEESLTWAVENLSWTENILIFPDIDPENPENAGAPIVVSENEETNEMDEVVKVQLENWETELIRQWDLWDAIQINQ